MINFVDRIPTQTGRRKITHADGTVEYVIVEMADNPTVVGTPLNRAAFMALQGFEATTTSISKANGVTTITETNANNEQKVTTISKADGVTTVTMVFTATDNSTITATTTISKTDGVTTISKVVS